MYLLTVKDDQHFGKTEGAENEKLSFDLSPCTVSESQKLRIKSQQPEGND